MAIQMSAGLAALHDELRYEPVSHLVRVRHGDEVVAETTSAMLVWEPRRIVPSYAVPRDDLRAEVVELDLPPDDPATTPPVLHPVGFAPHLSSGQVVSLRVGDSTLDRAGFAFSDRELAGFVLLDWNQFTWVEEATTMTGHAQDPFKRIKTLAGERRIQVSLDGETLADSRRAVLLLETGLPPRWYLPAEDVRMELLEPSSKHTVCAYKGRASYWSLKDNPRGRAIAWFYPDPLHDALPVKDLICFWAERTDLAIDGTPVPRPVSPFGEDA